MKSCLWDAEAEFDWQAQVTQESADRPSRSERKARMQQAKQIGFYPVQDKR